MQKLVVLKLDGDLVEGVRVTLEIGAEGDRAVTEVRGNLPPKPDMITNYNDWQSTYRSLGDLRLTPIGISIGDSSTEQLQNCRFLGDELSKHLNSWLNSDTFRSLKEKLLKQLTADDTVRVLIKTDDIWLRRLPWHLWDFFEDYSKAEVALSAPEYEHLPSSNPATSRDKVKILAILGNSEGIFIEKDRELLEKLPNAETNFLVEPQRSQLNERLWEQGWDILFFAGHSSSQSDGKTGNIYINPTDILTINELRYALNRAVRNGLQLAIFNSCDGLGLARQLEDLHIPQIIVMREPVPDKVAQEFLKNFLSKFSGGEPLYLAVRESRERLHGIEDEYPCATWLPVLCQNPAAVPPTWNDLLPPEPETDQRGRGNAVTRRRGFVDTETRRHGDRENVLETSPRHRVTASPSPLQDSQPEQHKTRLLPRWRSFQIVLVASVVVTSLVMGVRSLGLLQSWELKAFDQLMVMRPDEKPDPRLLIVTVDEADIQYQNKLKMNMRWSLSDQALAKLLKKLERYQPRTIGLDIYRDSSVDPNYPDLATRLEQDNRIFAACKVSAASDGAPAGIPPPPEVPEKRLSFSDFVADDDEIARRQLLHLTPPLTSRCAAEYAFSLQIAFHYLEAEGIKSDLTPEGHLRLGDVVFKQLKPHTSGYQRVDASGYQVLLNYRSLRSPQDIAKLVPLEDVLTDQINPELAELVQNRIVLIGVTAPSTVDYWKTPYSARALPNQKQVPGVFVQAHMVSHILSAVLDRRPLIWWWPVWVEVLWVWGWSLVGGTIAWRIRQPLHLVIAGVTGLGVLSGICFGIFTQAGWVPLVPSALALVATQAAVVLKTAITRKSYLSRK